MKRKSNGGVIAAIIAVVLAVVLVLVCGIGSSWFTNSDIATWFNSWGKGEQSELSEENDPVIEEGEGSLLPGHGATSVRSVSLQTMAVSNEISEGVTKQITATVEPADAENKAVDWSIEWIGDVSENISDYLIVTPVSDGSLTANVKCIKSFRGKGARVIATARDGGVSGTCLVSYEGEPSAFVINNVGSTATVQSNFKSSITVPVSLTNVFGDVGEDYLNDITVSSVSVTADVYTYDAEFDIYGYWEETSVTKNKYTLSQIKNLNNQSQFADDTFTANYSDGQITVTSSEYLNSESFAYGFTFSGSSGTYTGAIDHVENCVMTIKLECEGLTGTLIVNYRAGVNGVTLPSSISF